MVRVIAARRAPRTTERVITGWAAAFNARDLDGMLAWMDAEVDFHPLSLSGDCRVYRGHDGIREWFGVLSLCRRELRVERLTVGGHASGVIIASGVLTRINCVEPSPFCGLHRIEQGLIVAAHHYLSDPGSLLELDPAIPIGA